ncbi:MAG: hypothetical protein KC418_24295 [Anaerolineales bacterium]|nr:hypothetical protein [Anaerolineales bacterium]MCB8951638.1 hypothetical protein [Ardenticatenales bacterium]
MAIDTATKTVETAKQGVEALVKKAWSVMEAATEKEKASQYLSEKGIKAIQGKS